MALHWSLTALLWCLSLSLSSSSSSSSSSMATKCQRSCGSVSLPYPFGVGEDPTCFRNKEFKITCNESFTPAKALLKGAYEVLDISIEGHLRIKSPVDSICYTENGNRRTTVTSNDDVGFDETPFTYSNTRNKFTVIGCDTQASMMSTIMGLHRFSTGCISGCWNTDSVINGSCTGIGCCKSTFPGGIKRFTVDIFSGFNHTKVWSFNPCGIAFLVDEDFDLNFSASDLAGTNFQDRVGGELPVVLDWVAAVGNETCQEAKRNESMGYACLGENSECYNSTNGPGYRCRCSPGYEGNPYVHEGCQDIDECKDETSNNCRKGNCINIAGSYQCKCPDGYSGDGWNNGTSCIADVKGFPLLKFTLGTSLSLLFLLLASSWTYWLWRKRRSMKLKEKLFQQNGGLMLQQKICSRRGDTFKIFTAKELESATNNYNASTIVGQGGYGIVYKGILPNNRIVAIKKSKLVDASQIEQFINELDILSQINHRNVVKLLGCCLEDQVPILVYEFISNGTLYHHIHEAGHLPSISFKNRLRIVTEIAEALSYLHSAASMPVFHRDIKSANILLDNNFTAKVADFGVSRLVPIDQTQITTLVQGTWGYLDPECFQTGKLTEKSDVYSFGVVLVELLTREKAVCMNRPQDDRNLAMLFVHAMKENRLFQTLEASVRSEGKEEQLMAVAQVALRCLQLKGEERPTMKEVVVDLQGLRGFQEHPWVNNKETEKLMFEISQDDIGDASGQYYIENDFTAALQIMGQDISLTLSR